MYMTFRWFGPGDPIPLEHIRQIPVIRGVVSALYDVPVGQVTSGTYSPTLKKGVGMALIASQVTDGAEVSVDVRGRREIFTVTKPPFVTPGVRES